MTWCPRQTIKGHHCGIADGGCQNNTTFSVKYSIERSSADRLKTVGSRVDSFGLQCPRPGIPDLRTLGLCYPRPRQRQASGGRSESEPAVSRSVVSSLFGKNPHEAAQTTPRKGSKTDGVNPVEAPLDILACHIPFGIHKS